jgi:putative membrane protein
MSGAHAHVADAAPGFGALDGAILAAVAAAALAYAVGCARARRTAAGRRALPQWRALAFAAGWSALGAALSPPLATFADSLFAAHMLQHELLVLVAPPLVVLGRPALVWLWALPSGARRACLRPLRARAAATLWRVLGAPLPALGIHAAVLWLWHAAPAFEWALRDDLVHAVQHASFYASAALFWWSLLHGRFGRVGYGAAVLFVFATALHSGALGALLVVASAPWYPTQAARAAAAGHDALADQQLAGLLMWIPAGVVLGGIALALFAAWLGEAGRRRTRLIRSG